jgi:hypothetical protein
MLAQRRQSLQPICDDIHLMAVLAQQQLQKIGCDRAVFGDKYLQPAQIVGLSLDFRGARGRHYFFVVRLSRRRNRAELCAVTPLQLKVIH